MGLQHKREMVFDYVARPRRPDAEVAPLLQVSVAVTAAVRFVYTTRITHSQGPVWNQDKGSNTAPTSRRLRLRSRCVIVCSSLAEIMALFDFPQCKTIREKL